MMGKEVSFKTTLNYDTAKKLEDNLEENNKPGNEDNENIPVKMRIVEIKIIQEILTQEAMEVQMKIKKMKVKEVQEK